MTSPINNINRANTSALTNNASKSREKDDSTSSTASSSASEDKVSLSQETKQMRELQQKLDSVPEIDAEKVAAIKKEIANGNYPLDADRIAENLINLEKALVE